MARWSGATVCASTADSRRWSRSRAGLGGAACADDLRLCAADAPELIELARGFLPAGRRRAGATLVGGVLVARLLAEDPLALRRAFALFWTGFRAAVAGLPPVLPRLWHV